MNSERVIFAVDPGTTQSAFVVWDSMERMILDKGIIENKEIIPYLTKQTADLLAVEMIASYGMPVGKEVFETCLWIGRYLQACIFPSVLVYRREVKMFLCGSARAKDSNIRQALIDLLGKEVTKGVSKDVWAALGVAVTVKGERK